MDGPRFDTLARTLAASHRTSRKTLLGAGLGLLLAGRRRDAAADCKKVGRSCDRDGDCCRGAECQGGACQCKSGFTDCSGRCKNLDTNTNHCGACDTGCGRGETCCSGDCADLDDNHDHCGSCGHVCGDTELCIIGLCQPCPADGVFCGECCTPPLRECCDDVCIAVHDDADNCGACGRRCSGPRCCSFGQCVAEEDFESDRHNCGACGVDCIDGTLCCNGRCRVDCGGRCCQGFETCVSGHCIIV